MTMTDDASSDDAGPEPAGPDRASFGGDPSGPRPGYPVVLDLTGRHCLVVGGGPVAARRAAGIVAAGGRVTVVAPRTAAVLDEHPDITVEHRTYRAGEAAQYDLVVTATGDVGVDRSVVADATAAGILAAGAVASAPGTIRLPAVHRDGPVTVAVSTGGSSPALARWLLRRATNALPSRMATIASLLEEARQTLRAAGRPTDSIDWPAVLDEQLVPLVEAGRIDEARAAIGQL